jgi:probable HAF family extracellular repeat protein
MRSKLGNSVVFVMFSLVMLAGVAPQDNSSKDQKSKRHQYKLIDIGTLGGPSAYGSGNGPGSQLLNNAGAVVGTADTSTPDPNAPNCANPDCFLSHGFRWQDGVLTDLGAFPGVNRSEAKAINAHGWITGDSTNGVFDPVTGGAGGHAVLWKDGEIIDLGTLGTGVESDPFYVNNGGEVVGISTVDTRLDPFASAFGPFSSATHAFIWKNGVMRDLGTLGGPDSFVASGCNNQRAELLAGSSYLNSTPNPATGLPTMDPFLWKNGTMTDLGTLGGTFGFSQCANNSGQVIGQSNLAGDVISHPFLWEEGVLKDLGTLGGDNGFPYWINDAGEIVGKTDLPGGQVFHAFLWRKGTMTDLGSLATNSAAFAINSKHQIVGRSRIGATSVHATLWENGGPIIDLNTLIPANASLQLEEADGINDRGEIVGLGAPPGVPPSPESTGLHAFLLIPCGEGDEGCGDNATGLSAETQSSPAALTQQPTTVTPANRGVLDQLRRRAFPGHHPLGPETGTTN